MDLLVSRKWASARGCSWPRRMSSWMNGLPVMLPSVNFCMACRKGGESWNVSCIHSGRAVGESGQMKTYERKMAGTLRFGVRLNNSSRPAAFSAMRKSSSAEMLIQQAPACFKVSVIVSSSLHLLICTLFERKNEALCSRLSMM